MASAARTEAACIASAAKFDWDAHNAAMDAGMAKLRETFAAYDKVEADPSAAHIDLAHDMAAIIEGMGK